jgi:hypothetical protein
MIRRQGSWSSAKSARRPSLPNSSNSDVSLQIAQLHLDAIDRTYAGIADQGGDVTRRLDVM